MLAAFFVLLFVLNNFCFGGIKPFVELSLDFQFNSPPVGEVRNVPESIRNVPPHHDDFFCTPGPIRQDSGDAPWMAEIRFLKLGLETDLSQTVVWRNYGDLSFDYGHYLWLGGDINRRNYTNHPDTEKRGYGAALTFWSPGYSLLIPGFRSELQFKNKDEGFWFLGTGFRRYDFGIITGYDRYDSLSEHDFFELGKIQEISLYLGGRTNLSKKHWFGEGRIGMNFNSFDPKEQYREVDVETNKVSFFMVFSGGFRF